MLRFSQGEKKVQILSSHPVNCVEFPSKSLRAQNCCGRLGNKRLSTMRGYTSPEPKRWRTWRRQRDKRNSGFTALGEETRISFEHRSSACSTHIECGTILREQEKRLRRQVIFIPKAAHYCARPISFEDGLPRRSSFKNWWKISRSGAAQLSFRANGVSASWFDAQWTAFLPAR